MRILQTDQVFNPPFCTSKIQTVGTFGGARVEVGSASSQMRLRMAGEMGYRYGVDNDFQNSRKALVMMNLWELGAQNDACVLHFSPTTPTNYRERLSELGFVVGASIQCLRITPFGGPRIYKVGGCIYSLDRELAQMIHIGPETEEIR